MCLNQNFEGGTQISAARTLFKGNTDSCHLNVPTFANAIETRARQNFAEKLREYEKAIDFVNNVAL